MSKKEHKRLLVLNQVEMGKITGRDTVEVSDLSLRHVRRLAEHRGAIARAEWEIERLREQMANRSFSTIEAELIRQELKVLRDQNLLESTFKERTDLVVKLGIRIMPSEDLKSRKVFCRLNLARVSDEKEQAGFAKVTYGGPLWIRTTDPGLIRTVL